MSDADPFAGIDVVAEIAARARALGLDLASGVAEALATHARAVLAANRTTNLTRIVDPHELLDRHVAESLAGAAALSSWQPPRGADRVLDLGSGNGYPGLPVALALGLRPALVEASSRKATFLSEVLARCAPDGEVVASHVDRASDVAAPDTVAVLTTRAMGGWEKVVPRVARALPVGAAVLVWAGADADAIVRRAAWRRDLTLVATHELPTRASARLWRLAR